MLEEVSAHAHTTHVLPYQSAAKPNTSSGVTVSFPFSPFPANCLRDVIPIRKTTSHRLGYSPESDDDRTLPRPCPTARGRKAQLASQLRIRRLTLPPPVTTSSTTIISSTTAQASSLSPQPALSSPRHVTPASTPSSNDTALQPSDAGAAPSNPPQPVIQTYAGGTWQPNVPSLALQVPSIGTTFPLAPAHQAQLGGAPLPITLPLTTTQPNTSGATLPASLPITLPLMASQATTSGASLPVTLPLMASQVNTSGASLPVTLPLMASQANTSGATLPAMLPVTLPLVASQVNTSGATLPATISPLSSQAQPQPVNLQLIAQQAAQLAAEQAVARFLTLSFQPQSLPPLPAALHNFSQPASHTSPHLVTVPATVAGVFQPPAATTETISCLQAALATRAAAPTQPGPSNIYLAPLSGTIPTIPAKFVTAAAGGEFIDFNELLHALKWIAGEEPALCIQVEEGQHLALPRKPKKKKVNGSNVSLFMPPLYVPTSPTGGQAC